MVDSKSKSTEHRLFIFIKTNKYFIIAAKLAQRWEIKLFLRWRATEQAEIILRLEQEGVFIYPSNCVILGVWLCL